MLRFVLVIHRCFSWRFRSHARQERYHAIKDRAVHQETLLSANATITLKVINTRDQTRPTQAHLVRKTYYNTYIYNIYDRNKTWAITKNRYTWSVLTQKEVQPPIK